jgi:hypothetical protein
LFIEFFNKRNNSVLQVKRKINSLQEKFQKNERKKKNAGKQISTTKSEPNKETRKTKTPPL